MMFRKFVPIMLLTVLFIGGCASSGNKKLGSFKEDKIQVFLESIQTKQDALDKLGEPSDKDFDARGFEKWVYSHTQASAKVSNFIPIVRLFSSGYDQKSRKIIFLFDENDVVVKRLFSKSADQHTQGLVPQN